VRAVILGQIPDPYTSSSITAYDLSLVGMNDHIIDWAAVRVASLDGTAASLPYLDRAIFRACDHPFPLTMKCDASNIARVTFEREERVWVGGLDIVELYCVMASGSKEALIGRYTEPVDLGIGVLDCA
jgi:hypothetical protein